jgi:hypothetical protein
VALAYETGAASSPADFVTKLGVFAAANGWAVDAVTGGVVFHVDDIVVGMNSDSANINMRGGTAYNGAAAWNAQTNAPSAMTCIMDIHAGPYTAYHFWVGDEGGRKHVHATVEITDGVFRHLSFGHIIKLGTYTGGVYIDAVNWDETSDDINVPDSTNHQVIGDAGSGLTNRAHIWVDYDSKTNNFQYVYQNDSFSVDRCYGSVRFDGIFAALVSTQYMKWNLRTALYPIEYFVGRPSSLFSPIGRIPNMRQLNLRNIAPGGELIIASETWKCFPLVSRTDSSGSTSSSTHSSSYYGYAFRMP